MFLAGPIFLSFTEHAPLGGENVGIIRWNDQATRWIDGLSKGPQILAWVGIALAIWLAVSLVLVLTGTPAFGWAGVMFVFVAACAGYGGSKTRNGHRQRSQG
jgi:hypothetical protein